MDGPEQTDQDEFGSLIVTLAFLPGRITAAFLE